jgi:hypothetical protein
MSFPDSLPLFSEKRQERDYHSEYEAFDWLGRTIYSGVKTLVSGTIAAAERIFSEPQEEEIVIPANVKTLTERVTSMPAKTYSPPTVPIPREIHFNRHIRDLLVRKGIIDQPDPQSDIFANGCSFPSYTVEAPLNAFYEPVYDEHGSIVDLVSRDEDTDYVLLTSSVKQQLVDSGIIGEEDLRDPYLQIAINERIASGELRPVAAYDGSLLGIIRS